MTRSAELSEAAWARIEPLMPQAEGRSRPWRDHRQVVEGIVFRYRAGVAWRDLPERFGPWQTVWKRHHRFATDGTWDMLAEVIQSEADAADRVDWSVSVDSSIVRAHQHSATAKGVVLQDRARREEHNRGALVLAAALIWLADEMSVSSPACRCRAGIGELRLALVRRCGELHKHGGGLDDVRAGLAGEGEETSRSAVASVGPWRSFWADGTARTRRACRVRPKLSTSPAAIDRVRACCPLGRPRIPVQSLSADGPGCRRGLVSGESRTSEPSRTRRRLRLCQSSSKARRACSARCGHRRQQASTCGRCGCSKRFRQGRSTPGGSTASSC